jgi:hypothetical protein
MTKFAEQLYADLMRQHGSELAAMRPPTASQRRITARRALLAGGAGGVAVAATATALVAAGGGRTPAYALITNHDGTVTLAVYQESGIAQANAKLRQLGDNVVVVPVGAGCPSIGSLRAPAVQPGDEIGLGGYGSRGGSITVVANGVPDGDIMVVAVQTTAQGVRLASRLTSPPAPSCVSLPASTSGGPGSGPGVGPGGRPGTVSGSRRGPASGPAGGSRQGLSLHQAHGGSGPSLSRNG